jgi:hypothetical protein
VRQLLYLTMTACTFYTETTMKPINETDAKLRQRLLRECEGVVAERGIQEESAPQYLRYVDSKKRNKEHLKRIMYIVRLFGPERVAKIGKSDQTGILREIADNPAQSEDGSARLSLWKAMREYLRAEGESKTADIAAYLESKGYANLSRQTIESAIKRHSETFRVRRRKRERFVSIKETDETQSSSDDD